jgi:hypothetical protein
LLARALLAFERATALAVSFASEPVQRSAFGESPTDGHAITQPLVLVDAPAEMRRLAG